MALNGKKLEEFSSVSVVEESNFCVIFFSKKRELAFIKSRKLILELEFDNQEAWMKREELPKWIEVRKTGKNYLK